MASPVSDAYGGTERRSAALNHTPPRIVLPGFDVPPHSDFQRMWPLWRTLRDCYEGETRIKEARETYLPRLSAHRAEEYDGYLRRAYFYNAVRRTHTGLMGSLFRKKPEFTLPASLSLDLTDITLDGQSAEEFCRSVAHEVVLTGRYGILVDLPLADTSAPGFAPKPYAAGYAAESVYSWRITLRGGRRVVDRVILRETETRETEYGEETAEIVRILRLDPGDDGELVYSQQIIRPSAEANGPVSVTSVPVTVLGRTLSYIPFIFVNSSHLLPSCVHPPLSDIAAINVSHYQSTALLEHARFYAGMPTYVTSAGTDASPSEADSLARNMSALTVGPSNVWELESGAKAWILEFNGHGLVFLENAVDSKQLQMQSLGGKLISAQRKAAALSSEAWTLLETGDEATLMDVAVTVEKAVALTLTRLAEFGGMTVPESSPIVVEVNKEFVRSDLTAREIRAIQALYERGLIPLDILYYALREVNVIPVEYTLEEFKKLLGQSDQKYVPPEVETSYQGTSASLGRGARAPSGTNNPPSGSPD